MALDIERDIRGKLKDLPKDHPDRAFLEAQAQVFAAFNAGKEVSQTPELNLDLEWQKQAQNLAKLFAKELGESKQEYIESLPRFFPQPEAYKGRFDISVIVETRIPLAKMAKILGITSYYDTNKTKDWEDGKFETPKVPYVTWLNNGSVNLGKSVESVRGELREDERAGTAYDGLALFARDRKILEHHYLDLPGSVVEPGRAPGLYLWNGEPRLILGFVDDPLRKFGSVVAGVEIRA